MNPKMSEDTMSYYYVNQANETAGPVSIEELKRLLAAGEIHWSSQVVPEGSSQWKPLRNLPEFAGLAPELPNRAKAGVSGNWESLLGNVIEWVLALSKRLLSPDLVANIRMFGVRYGQMSILLTAGAAVLGGIVAAIRIPNGGGAVLAGSIVLVILLAIAQFSANRFIGSCEVMLKATKTRTSTTAIYDILGLVFMLVAVLLFLSISAVAIAAGGLGLMGLFLAILALIVYGCVAAASFHLSQLAMDVDEATGPGENAVCLLSYFLKLKLYLAPIGFGALTIFGGVLQIVTVLVVLVNPDATRGLESFLPVGGAMVVVGGAILALIGAFFPLLAYFYFMIMYLIIDIIKSIVSIPGKLDKLRKD
ncbi:MAG: GYF domain-containing protein [Verrucomicrobia bacterium]|nr:GYF domain-containing protein [Verrucomicrobiota bacterium]